MKVNEIEISGFKGITYLIIHPKKINIFVGKNNTGKTSILEAISSTLESNIYDMQTKYSSHLSSLININKKESKVIVKLENENKYLLLRIPELIEIIPEFKTQLIEKIKLISHPTIKENEWKKIEELLDKILSNEDLLHKIKKESIRIESGNKVSYVFSYTSILKELEPLIEHLNKNILHMGINPLLFFLSRSKYSFSSITDENSKIFVFIKNLIGKTLLSSMNKSKINDIENYLKNKKILENLERFDIDKLLFKNNEKEYEIPFSFMGDGFKALIGLIVQMPKEAKIVLIEEPENHMHPAYIKEIVQQIINFSMTNDTQFFITTHNSDILDIVSTDILEPQYQEYLSKELNLIRLDWLNDNIMVQELNKKEALEELEELKIDLRGK